jgi:hypothetical protein
MKDFVGGLAKLLDSNFSELLTMQNWIEKELKLKV